MKKIIIVSVLLFFTYGIICSGQTANVISVDADKPISAIQPTMWGIFFEDINFAADGGIYASAAFDKNSNEIILRMVNSTEKA